MKATCLELALCFCPMQYAEVLLYGALRIDVSLQKSHSWKPLQTEVDILSYIKRPHWKQQQGFLSSCSWRLLFIKEMLVMCHQHSLTHSVSSPSGAFFLSHSFFLFTAPDLIKWLLYGSQASQTSWIRGNVDWSCNPGLMACFEQEFILVTFFLFLAQKMFYCCFMSWNTSSLSCNWMVNCPISLLKLFIHVW